MALLAQTVAESQLMHSLASSATAVTVLDSATQVMARAAELAPVTVAVTVSVSVQEMAPPAATRVVAQAMVRAAAT